jgi:outer membrane protein assembly factor BamA
LGRFGSPEITHSLKKGDLFQRGKVAVGLEKVRELYLTNGYLEITMIPDSRIIGDRVNLMIGVEESSQFHMGKLQIFAKGEQADKLRAAWSLSEGAVFDVSYLEKYTSDNAAVLPVNVTPRFAQVVRNCRESTVEVRLPVDPLDPRSLVRPKDIDCDSHAARAEH